MINQLGKQLFILSVITTLIALLLHTFGVNLILGALIGIVVQLVVFNAFVYGLETFAKIKTQKLEVERLKLTAYQGVEALCPCGFKQFVPIRLNASNYYKCKKCSKTVSVFTAVETALVTEPIADTSLIEIDNLLQDKLNEFTR